MGVFGVKVLENDVALDIYGEFFDLYDSGVDIKEIKEKFKEEESSVKDDPDDYELFLCAYALACWEVGALDIKTKKEVGEIVKKSNLKNILEKEGDADLAKKRQKALDQFLRKISSKNLKPKKRSPRKKIKNFIFEEDDVLMFQLNNGTYCYSIIPDISQFKTNEVVYYFLPTTLNSKIPADLKSIESVIGSEVNTGWSEAEVRKVQPETVEIYWKKKPPSSRAYPRNYMLQLTVTAIYHQNLIKFKDKFKVIGKIKLKAGYNDIGTIFSADNFDSFQEDYERIFLTRKSEQKLPLEIIAKGFNNDTK